MNSTILAKIAVLKAMDLAQLRQQWQGLFGRPAPVAYKPEQLMRRMAWKIQELHFGGLSDACRERLRQIAATDDLAQGRRPQPRRKASRIAPGTRLIRSWGGREHVVTALVDGGWEHAGQRYRTLTAAAEAISGQHISGHRFFGLAQLKKGVI